MCRPSKNLKALHTHLEHGTLFNVSNAKEGTTQSGPRVLSKVELEAIASKCFRADGLHFLF